MASRSAIRRYYAFRITSSAGFYLPVSVLYLKHQGLGAAEIGLVQAVFSFSMVAAEIPSGYLGDRIGRRGSLALGNGLRVVALTGYAAAETVSAFAALQAVWAVGWAFRSGTQDAWLYELLQSCCDESEYARVDGRGSTFLLATSAVTATTSGVLYAVDPALPFLANAGLAAAGIPILVAMPSVETDGDAETFTVGEAVQTLRLQARRPSVRWLVAYSALFSGLFGVTRTFEQPAMEAVGVPVAGIGLLYAGFKVVSAGAASTTGRLQERLGTRRAFGLLVPVLGLAYASVAAVGVLIVPVILLYRSTRVVLGPIRNQYVNDRLTNVGRATVLSGISMVLSMVNGTATVVGGRIIETTGPVGFLPWAGVGIAGAAGVLWLAVSPVRDGSAAGTPPGAVGGD